ncbi:hypothetical protein C8Q78DRAFT_1005181 [Trametes maxima]|nr:hypothetical protein C8Q78DRAFT_1005181 [Trametes maxima]
MPIVFFLVAARAIFQLPADSSLLARTTRRSSTVITPTVFSFPVRNVSLAPPPDPREPSTRRAACAPPSLALSMHSAGQTARHTASGGV